MKRILVALLLVFQFGSVFAQSNTENLIQKALQLYSDSRHNEVLDLLDNSNDSRAVLISAKSNYALGNYSISVSLSRSLLSDPNPIIKSEALFILSIASYHQGNIAGSLNNLDQLIEMDELATSSIIKQANDYRRNLINSLSYQQRLDNIGKIRDSVSRRELVIEHFHSYPRDLAVNLIQELSRHDPDFDEISYISTARNLSNSVSIPAQSHYVSGSIINIGILLPSFETDVSNRTISRGLYNGVLIAVDEYNRTHSDRKVQVHFIETEQLSRASLDHVSREIENRKIDAIIGPLFSEQVRDIGIIAKRQGIPVFAPLANTFDRIDMLDHVFQMNPTFTSRGESTARIAFEILSLRKIGVMAEAGSQGELDARAFVETFTELGGEIPYHFIENFAEMGYFVGDLTPWFSSDQALVDSTAFLVDTLDAAYFPFTGEVAGTLLNLTLTGLEAYNPDYLVLSNEEMAYISHSSERLSKLNLFYTGTSYLDQSSIESQNFRFDYLNRSGIDPNTFSYVGYDLGKYYLWAVDLIGNPDDFMIYVPALEPFKGLSNSIYFGSDKNNRALYLFEIKSTGTRIVD